MPMRDRLRPRARDAGVSNGARAALARGFTLVELMTVVSIVSVLLGVCAPSFSEFLANQQAKGLTYDLMSDLILARNEALKRNASVSLARGSGGWQYGWTTSASSGETLSQRNAVSQTVTVSGAPATITFDVNGRVSAPTTAVRITVSAGSSSRCVQLDPSGRARSLLGACT